MGIYIKGMEMPGEIVPGLVMDFAENVDGKRYARLYHYRYGGVTDWHEITEVPEPHGRLGDLDDIIKRAKKWIDHPDEYINQRNKDMIYILEREDAIIPASEEN